MKSMPGNKVSTLCGNNKQQQAYTARYGTATGSLLAMSSLSEALQLCPFTGDASAGAMMLATAGFTFQDRQSKKQHHQQQQPVTAGNTSKQAAAHAVQRQLGWK
jgi:hypothetical protein